MFKKGITPWNKGRKWTDEEKNNISLGLKNSVKFQTVVRSLEYRKKLRKHSIGNHYGRALKGIKFTEEHKRKISEALKGKIVSTETRKRQSEANKRRIIEGKHHFWKGGKSFEPYTLDWTRTLRISIRERDKYTCQICGEKQGDTVFSVHHIDYDKKNCNSANLITLCKSCHSKTNTNREYWKQYFQTNN